MTSTGRPQIVTFRLAGDLFAADIFSVERVLRHQPPTAVRNLPPWIEGVIEYRGRVVPMIDLRKRFELPPGAVTGETRILVFTVKGDWIAAVVDAVVEVTSIERSELSEPPALFRGLAGEYLTGIARRGGRLVVFLDVERILSTTERLVLEQVTEAAAANG